MTILVGTVPNSVVLMFVRGWRGGTCHDIARELETTPEEIENASLQKMGDLMRRAQLKCTQEILGKKWTPISDPTPRHGAAPVEVWHTGRRVDETKTLHFDIVQKPIRGNHVSMRETGDNPDTVSRAVTVDLGGDVGSGA